MSRLCIVLCVVLLGSLSWAQAPIPPPTASDFPLGGTDETDTDEVVTPPGTPPEGGGTVEGTDNQGQWSILGNGYAELKNVTDARAAFSLSLLRTERDQNQLLIGVSRGAEDNTLSNRDAFASFMLSPETSSWSAYVKYDRWPFRRRTFVWGWYVNGTVGSATWQLALDQDNPDAQTSKSAVALALSGGFSIGYSMNSSKNTLRILGHVGPSVRTLVGNVWSDDAFLKAAIGRSQRQFVGGEAGFWIQLNTISVGMTLPILAGHVPGLTNGQFLPSVSVGGKIDLSALVGGLP